MELNNSIGVTSTGDMGQGVAMCIKAMGFNVCMATDGRSSRTRALGEKAGLTDCGSLEKLGTDLRHGAVSARPRRRRHQRARHRCRVQSNFAQNRIRRMQRGSTANHD